MDVSCPVSEERVNENIVRIIAFMVAIIGAFCLVFVNFWAVLFLVIDFAIRSFTNGKLSVLRFLALQISGIFNLGAKPTDLAPKKFAATMGFSFCVVICIFYFFDYPTFAFCLTILLLFFAILESVFAVCVGCHVYTLLQKLKIIK